MRYRATKISRDENFSILPLNWENGLRPGGSNRPTGLSNNLEVA